MSKHKKHEPACGFLPQDFPAPCGCKMRLDHDGLVRWEQCRIHSAAKELLEQLKALAVQVESAGLVVPPGVTSVIRSVECEEGKVA